MEGQRESRSWKLDLREAYEMGNVALGLGHEGRMLDSSFGKSEEEPCSTVPYGLVR